MADPTYKDLAQIEDRTNDVVYNIKAKGLESPITFSATGDVTGTSQSTNLSGNVDIPTTIGTGKVTETKLATDSVTTTKLKDGNITFEKLAASATSGSIAEGTADKLATKVEVKNYVENVMKGKGEFRGVQTVETINSWTLANLNNGDYVIVSGSGTVVIDGNSLAVTDGEDLVLWKYTSGGTEHGQWQDSESNVKHKQTAYDSDAQSGSQKGGTGRTLTRIEQNANGNVTPTFSDISITSSQVSDKVSTFDGTGSNKNKLVDGEAVKDAIDPIIDAIDALEDRTDDDDEVIASALVDLDSRLAGIEETVNDKNIGDRTASSLDAQVLKIGGTDIGEKLNGIEAGAQVNKIETIKCNNTTLSITNKAVNIPAATDAEYGVVQFMTSAEAQSMWAAAWAAASAT